MKNTVGNISLLLLLTCGSCSSTYQFSVDIQEPAAVTLPVSAQNVLILDNTIVQPENNGMERTYNGQSIHENYPLYLDSMVWSAIDEMAIVLNESNFFKTIAIYQKPLRTDTEWLAETILSPEEQADFYNTENYDALLVIDRLLFSVKENVKKIQDVSFSYEPSAFVDLRTDGLITCSMYAFGKDKPLTTFTVSDSLFLKSMVANDSTILFKVLPEYLLDELSRVIGNQAATHFIPTWKTTERMFFTGYNSRMQEAVGYAADKQWLKAESVWASELENKTKPADKAKIAFNLAVTNEMQDKFDEALEWAQKAKDYLQSANPNKDSKEIDLTNEYISLLKQRIQSNRLLDLQWGKE